MDDFVLEVELLYIIVIKYHIWMLIGSYCKFHEHLLYHYHIHHITKYELFKKNCTNLHDHYHNKHLWFTLRKGFPFSFSVICYYIHTLEFFLVPKCLLLRLIHFLLKIDISHVVHYFVVVIIVEIFVTGAVN